MATTKNITMKQFNGTDYDTLYPKTIAKQVEGIYGKDEILNNATKALYGLTSSAVPDDVLAFLGRYSENWWRRRTWTAHYSAELSSGAYQYCLGGGSTSTASNTIYYSDSIVLDADGNTILVNEKSVSVSYSNGTSDTVQSLIGKYIRNAKESNPSSSSLPNTILYIDPSATISRSSGGDGNNKYGVYISEQGAKKATAVLLAPTVGEWGYMQSVDRSAYPDSGISGGYEYQYLGVPFDNAVTASKIATGSYTGTGTYGESNPCSLTFDFVPKLIVVKYYSYDISGDTTPTELTRWGYIIAAYLLDSDYKKYTVMDAANDNDMLMKIVDKTIYYYSKNSAGYQMNGKTTYFYMALG